MGQVTKIQHQDTLVRAIVKNDEAVLQTLYVENFRKTERYVLQNNGTSQEAKDVYQEAFLTVWQNVKKGKFEPNNETALEGYLYQIAKNKWIDFLRSSQYKKTTQMPEHLHIVSDNGVDTEKETLFSQQSEAVAKGFKELGNECQSLLKAFYFEKKSLRDIAKTFQINEASARNKKYRCILKLKTIISPDT